MEKLNNTRGTVVPLAPAGAHQRQHIGHTIPAPLLALVEALARVQEERDHKAALIVEEAA